MEITTIVLQILLGLAFFGAGGSKLAGVQSLKADFKRFGLQAVRLPAVVYVPHRNSGIDRRTWDDRWHLLTRMESPGRPSARGRDGGRSSYPRAGQGPGQEDDAGNGALLAGRNRNLLPGLGEERINRNRVEVAPMRPDMGLRPHRRNDLADEASVEASANGKPTTFTLKKGAKVVPASGTYVETTTGAYKATLKPNKKLKAGAKYTAAATAAAKDKAGNALVAKSWTFKVRR